MRLTPVHIWSAQVDPRLAERCSTELPSDLLAQLRRLPEPARRRRIVHQALRRSVLAERSGLSSRDLVLAYAPGNPIAAPVKGLLVSATHFDDLTALAVTEEGIGLGVDLEPRFEADWEDALELVLTGSERGELDAIPTDRRAALYFELWTLKESVMKALGDGLGDRDPASIGFGAIGDLPTLVSIDGRPPTEPWATWSGPLQESVFSIALRGASAIEPIHHGWPVDLEDGKR